MDVYALVLKKAHRVYVREDMQGIKDQFPGWKKTECQSIKVTDLWPALAYEIIDVEEVEGVRYPVSTTTTWGPPEPCMMCIDPETRELISYYEHLAV